MTALRPPLRVLYFAWLRERVGLTEESVVPPAEIATVAALRDWLRTRDARHEAAFAQPGLVRCAVNQSLAEPETPVHPGDEVAFFPPVTGG